MSGRLKGLRVLVTGSDSEPLSATLIARGAVPVAVPTIAILAADPAPLDRALQLSPSFDWIVVTSANGARVVLERLRATAIVLPATVRWAAVGPRTAAVLREGGIEPSFVPDEGTGLALANGLGDVAGVRVLLARALDAATDLPDALRSRDAIVEDVIAYETEEGPEASREPLGIELFQGLAAAVFTSGSTVRGFARLAGEPAVVLKGAIAVAIGPATAEVARAAGLDPWIADGRTPEAIATALEEAASARASSAGG